jgi:hypothetical protein
MDKDSKNLHKEIESTLLQSEQFKNSKNSKALLTYLFNCSLEGVTPKEITIAAEVFNKDHSFNPGDDPLVRVHIHNLRKKLDEYYQSGGKADRYRLEIPKGQYVIHITDRAERKKWYVLFQEKSKRFKAYPVLSALLVILCLLLLMQNLGLDHKLKKYRIVDDQDPVWGGFLQNENETVIVCGDHFFYTIPIPFEKRSVHIRDTWINSEQDMQYLIFPKQEMGVTASGQTYFPYACVWALPGIIKVLNSSPRQIVMRSSSQLTAASIEEQNMVYLGNIKSLGMLSHYVELANLRYDIRERVIYHITGADTIRYAPVANEDVYHKDYALIIKWQGLRGNSILLISSFFTIGAKEACRYLTERHLLLQLEQKLIESCKCVPKNFLMILEVSGIRQAITESKFILAESLDPYALRGSFDKKESAGSANK